MTNDQSSQLHIIDLSPTGTGHLSDRSSQFAAYLERLVSAQGRSVKTLGGNHAREALKRLSRSGRLSFGRDAGYEVRYNPSREAIATVFDREQPAWPERIQKRQQKSFRSTQGAIFRCPVEGDDLSLELFITDWSPSPGACAIAIHRYHPFARETRRPESVHFTGRYVRHPLTGDLLPVWVADWVKPDFGTGVVLINPAHDQADLAFGRQIGLPIRFALVPEGFDGSPSTWPTPPVIKVGVSIKTGFFDGLTPALAEVTYLNKLVEAGLGWRHTDHQVDRRRVAELVELDNGTLWFCEVCGLIDSVDEAEGPCPVCHHPRLRTMAREDWILDKAEAAAIQEAALTVVSPAAALETDLLLFRLLLHDLGARADIESVHVVHRSELNKAGTGALSQAAALVSARPSEVGVVRQQLVEQIERFFGTHDRLLQMAGEFDKAQLIAPPSTALRIKQALNDCELPQAFAILYTLQKQLVQDQQQPAGLLPYYALSHVLFGLPLPGNQQASTIWQALREPAEQGARRR